MPLYAFHPCKLDGSSATFKVLDLADDRDAIERADAFLIEHRTCESVAVWQDDRQVLVRRRTRQPA